MSEIPQVAKLVLSGEPLFAALYDRHYRSVRAFCRRRLATDLVDDAVAETFLTAWRRLDEVPEGDAAHMWLYGVASHVVAISGAVPHGGAGTVAVVAAPWPSRTCARASVRGPRALRRTPRRRRLARLLGRPGDTATHDGVGPSERSVHTPNARL